MGEAFVAPLIRMKNHISYLLNRVDDNKAQLVKTAQALVVAASPNPPGDVTLAAKAALDALSRIPEIELGQYETAPGIINLVATVKSGRPGKRLVFNGHLDTYPIGEEGDWSHPPLGAKIDAGRLYGRGVTDMKAGIAASICALQILSANKSLWCGEASITLAGDEESMGYLGTGWLLENVEEARGDVMICGDVGSPNIIRIGEKGLLWIRVTSKGVSAHGAHVHNGVNAIERLINALVLIKELENLSVNAPEEVTRTIEEASQISELSSGKGESKTLQKITVNIGVIKGGTSPNLVPSSAEALGDIRIPFGVSVEYLINRITEVLAPLEGIEWDVIRSFEPTFTSARHPIVVSALKVSSLVTGNESVANMRVGASDSRLYRRAGIPSIVLGCTPNNMGASNEYVEIVELVKVAKMHTILAFEYLEKPQE